MIVSRSIYPESLLVRAMFGGSEVKGMKDQTMTNNHDGASPLTLAADAEFQRIWVYWVELYGFDIDAAKWLALYQYAGGNAFGLTDVHNNINFAERGVA